MVSRAVALTVALAAFALSAVPAAAQIRPPTKEQIVCIPGFGCLAPPREIDREPAGDEYVVVEGHALCPGGRAHIEVRLGRIVIDSKTVAVDRTGYYRATFPRHHHKLVQPQYVVTGFSGCPGEPVTFNLRP